MIVVTLTQNVPTDEKYKFSVETRKVPMVVGTRLLSLHVSSLMSQLSLSLLVMNALIEIQALAPVAASFYRIASVLRVLLAGEIGGMRYHI